MVGEKGEITFIVKKWRVAVLPIVLMSLYAVLSVIVWVLDDPYTEARFIGMCIIVVPFIGVYVVYTAYWLTTTEPVFTINDQGLYDNTSPNGLGLIMWEEIKYMYVQKSRIGKGSLIIVPQNYDVILSRQDRSKRLFVKFSNVGFLPNFLVVSPVMLSTTMEELLTHIRLYHEVLPEKPSFTGFS